MTYARFNTKPRQVDKVDKLDRPTPYGGPMGLSSLSTLSSLSMCLWAWGLVGVADAGGRVGRAIAWTVSPCLVGGAGKSLVPLDRKPTGSVDFYARKFQGEGYLPVPSNG
jgi:hypothetical protein